MLIDCPACARSYHVSRAEIGEEGRAVICPRCDANWFVYGDGTTTLCPLPDDLHTASFSSRPAVTPIDPAPVRRRRSVWRTVTPAVAVALCVVAAMGTIGARRPIVRAVPRLAGLYQAIGLPVNVRGLEIATLTPRRLDATALEVAGEIRNATAHRVVVPRLVYEVRDATGAALLSWTEKAPAQSLGTGRTVSFVSTPHQLPPEGRSLLVRFADEIVVAPVRLARRTY